MSRSADLLINCYERTYRQTLTADTLRRILDDNLCEFRSLRIIVNNVGSKLDAEERCGALIDAGLVTSCTFVADQLDQALHTTGLQRRSLGRRPYFVDYGLVMATVGDADFLVGWDPEVTLDNPVDWVTPALRLLEQDPSVFSCAPRWPVGGFDTLEQETVSRQGPWALNWGFSDQVFAVRRADLQAPIYRRLAPAALARHARHPRTFEARVESYQRAAGRARATHTEARYSHRDHGPVLSRLGDERRSEVLTRKALNFTRRSLTTLAFEHPRFRLP